MNVYIPLLSTSDDNYLELRYALRGLEMYVNPDKVTTIGGLPKWAKGIKNIPAADNPDTKLREANIFNKLLLVPDANFLYFSDDNFLLQPWEGLHFYDSMLYNKLYALARGSIYRNTITNTLQLTGNVNNFDVHAPMNMNRYALHNMKKIDWTRNYGYCLKTIYAHMNGIVGTKYLDMKIRDHTPFSVADRKWFSTADGVVKDIRGVMEKLYSRKSKWES